MLIASTFFFGGGVDVSTYCIGDLHGQWELLETALAKIKFDSLKDRIYFLGDVIDGRSRGHGGLRILRFLMENSESCSLIRGNHESNFLDSVKRRTFDVMYDVNDDARKCISKAIDLHSRLLGEIEGELFSASSPKNILANRRVVNWLSQGRKNKRKEMLDAWLLALECVGADEEKRTHLRTLFSLMLKKGPFWEGELIRELATVEEDEYRKIIDYLERCPYDIRLGVRGRRFLLTHCSGQIKRRSLDFKSWVEFASAPDSDLVIVGGHQPVQEIWKVADECAIIQGMNPNTVLSYWDAKGNRYYDLDLGSGCVLLRLEDLEEFYIDGAKKPKEDREPWSEYASCERRNGLLVIKEPPYEAFIMFQQNCATYFGKRVSPRRVAYTPFFALFFGQYRKLPCKNNDSIDRLVEIIAEDAKGDGSKHIAHLQAACDEVGRGFTYFQKAFHLVD